MTLLDFAITKKSNTRFKHYGCHQMWKHKIKLVLFDFDHRDTRKISCSKASAQKNVRPEEDTTDFSLVTGVTP